MNYHSVTNDLMTVVGRIVDKMVLSFLTQMTGVSARKRWGRGRGKEGGSLPLQHTMFKVFRDIQLEVLINLLGTWVCSSGLSEMDFNESSAHSLLLKLGECLGYSTRGRTEEWAKEKRRGPARKLGTFYTGSRQQGDLVAEEKEESKRRVLS